MGDEIKVKGQVVKAQTSKDGALRVTIDDFGADQLQVLAMTQLVMEQAVIEFVPKVVES